MLNSWGANIYFLLSSMNELDKSDATNMIKITHMQTVYAVKSVEWLQLHKIIEAKWMRNRSET